jgi:hypothetical protein
VEVLPDLPSRRRTDMGPRGERWATLPVYTARRADRCSAREWSGEPQANVECHSVFSRLFAAGRVDRGVGRGPGGPPYEIVQPSSELPIAGRPSGRPEADLAVRPVFRPIGGLGRKIGKLPDTSSIE